MYFQRAMSARAIDSNPDATNAAATASVTESVPCGHRPTSNIAVAFGVYDCTTPGSRCQVGAITVTPCTLAKRRRAATSLATPFCRHTIGVDGGATADRASSTPSVSWLLTAMRTTSPSPNDSSAGCSTTGTGSVADPSGHSTVNPLVAIACRCSPRATSTTSCPCWNMRPPTTPPTAPAP